MASRMRDAVGVLLVEPGRVEVAGQRARAEEDRLVALAFLFGEAHHLDAEGQAPAGAVQLAHAGHRHEDAQPAVVLAAVAHGVVVAAGEQALRAAIACRGRRRPRCPPRRSPPRRSRSRAHPVRQALRAGAVRVGQVGDGELAALGVARVAVLRPGARPSPTPGCRARARWPNLSSRRISAMRWMLRRHSARSKSGWLLQPALEGGDDLGRVQPRAARPAHRQDEGEAELGVVVGVELLDRARTPPACSRSGRPCPARWSTRR